VKPETLCLAPWTHTYLSPQTERRMCCASREPAQNFQQYIDTKSGTGKYIPITLDEHWNSEHMKSVRRRMMAGETLPECDVCNSKLLNTDVYRNYFWQFFKHKYDDLMAATDETGYTTAKPISWDYRFSNLCNFKCRMCGDMLSSSWESEQRQHNMINWAKAQNNWMRPEIKAQITKFQDEQIEAEFAQAVEEHRVEEIYWVGGEPLMYEQHWRYMKRIIELGDGRRVYARYNTNLSRISYNNCSLVEDILPNLRDWQICASLDGTGNIGEYIRTGLDYEQWRENFKQVRSITKNRRQLRIDFTLTLPGLFEICNIEKLAAEMDVDILSKIIFTFSPDVIFSPLALPKSTLHRIVQGILPDVKTNAMKDMLNNLLTQPTLEEQYPAQYKQAMMTGKARMLKLESIRTAPVTLADILSLDSEAKAWYESIATS